MNEEARRMLTVTDSQTVAYFLGNGREVAAHDTVPFTIWAAARHLADFERAIWATRHDRYEGMFGDWAVIAT